MKGLWIKTHTCTRIYVFNSCCIIPYTNTWQKSNEKQHTSCKALQETFWKIPYVYICGLQIAFRDDLVSNNAVFNIFLSYCIMFYFSRENWKRKLHITKYIVELLFWYNNKANCSSATDRNISSVRVSISFNIHTCTYIHAIHIHNLLKMPYQTSMLFTLK